jgi:hypothetical protein
MQSQSRSPQALPVAWAEVLDNIDETLRRTEAAAAEREQTIAQIAPSADAESEHQMEEQLHLLQLQMESWPTVLQEAERQTSEADAAIQAAEGALHQWLSKAKAQAQGLAKGVQP